MRREILLGLSAALLLSVFTGCGIQRMPPADETDGKAMQVEKLDAAGETVFLLEDDAAAQAFFDDYLGFDDVPKDDVDAAALTPVCTYIVFQEATVHAGQTEPSGWDEILRYTLYEDSDIVTLEIVPEMAEKLDIKLISDALTQSYEGGAETVEYLKTCTAETIAE